MVASLHFKPLNLIILINFVNKKVCVGVRDILFVCFSKHKNGTGSFAMKWFFSVIFLSDELLICLCQ